MRRRGFLTAGIMSVVGAATLPRLSLGSTSTPLGLVCAKTKWDLNDRWRIWWEPWGLSESCTSWRQQSTWFAYPVRKGIFDTSRVPYYVRVARASRPRYKAKWSEGKWSERWDEAENLIRAQRGLDTLLSLLQRSEAQGNAPLKIDGSVNEGIARKIAVDRIIERQTSNPLLVPPIWRPEPLPENLQIEPPDLMSVFAANIDDILADVPFEVGG